MRLMLDIPHSIIHFTRNSVNDICNLIEMEISFLVMGSDRGQITHDGQVLHCHCSCRFNRRDVVANLRFYGFLLGHDILDDP